MQNLECNATKLVFSEVSSFKVNPVLDVHKIIKCVFNVLSSLHCHFLWNTHGHLTTIERRWRGRSTIWLYMLCTADGTSFEKDVWCTITVHTITFSEYFLCKWSTRLQCMYNHMVGRAASVVSSLLFHTSCYQTIIRYITN